MSIEAKGSKLGSKAFDRASSSSSVDSYCKGSMPRAQANGQEQNGGDHSPLPAGTPFGGRKGKLGDPSSFQRSLMTAQKHFSLEGEIRDFQVQDDDKNSSDGPQDPNSKKQPRLQVSVNDLKPARMESNPFQVVKQHSEESSIQCENEQGGKLSFFGKLGSKGLSLNLGINSMHRTVSTQVQDNTKETFQLKMSSARAIAEHDSADSEGSIGGNSKNLFAKMAALKTHTQEFSGAADEASKQANTVSFDDMLCNGVEMNRTSSIMGQPDSPGASKRNGQFKEALRKHYQKESLSQEERYKLLDGTQLQIEGPYHLQDYSYSLVSQCKEIKRIEAGIPFDPYLLLSPVGSENTSTAQQDRPSIRSQSLAAFEALLAKRKPMVEHSVLNRLNCHIEKFNELYKSIDHSFVDKNRYKDMLPFKFNRVVLNKEVRPFVSLRSVMYGSFDSGVRTKIAMPSAFEQVQQLPVFERHTNGRPVSQSIPQTMTIPDQPTSEDCLDDYINASWIDSCTKKQLMIAASAPNKSTVCDFLHLIMENNVKLVMKLCEDKVKDKEQCFKYTGKSVPRTTTTTTTPSMLSHTSTIGASSPPAQFSSTSKNGGVVKYIVQVLEEKRRFDEGLLIKKVKLTRKVYGHNSFFPRDEAAPVVKDDAAAMQTPESKAFDSLMNQKSEEIQSSSTSKAELQAPQLETEDTHYFTQVMDVAWEDHKAPTSRGDKQLNYLRMAYMVRKMIKQSRKSNLAAKTTDLSIFVPDPTILVHCSAGRGRTGTLIAAFLIAEQLLTISETVFPGANPREKGTQEAREEPDNFYTPSKEAGGMTSKTTKYDWTRISIFSHVRRLREQRWCMVSNDAQYSYCYQFLGEWIRNGETANLRSTLDKIYCMPTACQI